MSSSTSSPGNLMKQCTIRKGNGQNMTSQQSQMTIFDNLGIADESMQSAEVSHAKLFQLLESVKASMTLEELYSLTSCASQVSSDHRIYSLKTSKDLCHTTTGIPSRPSSERWMNSGMMSNGICLTLRTLEFHKTEKGCSLLDILEKEVPEKYFLSDQMTKRLTSYRDNKLQPIHSQQDMKESGTDRMLLKVNSMHKKYRLRENLT